ncbi:MAG: tRNA (adenosine(37)-N6)-threonylcarbamoyltransferase complex dimerization subunit type 1 TsaB [Bacilli bacterium]|nr:tRNA (adenosine(37)-N6)-threonylcarbamoyltransferase complex dimerization subunit type 1 TsaB [Bacilli bacterium]
MYCLFISTFDKLITIGLLKNGELIEELTQESNQNHSCFVMPMIDKIIKNNNILPSYLNEIIVVNGPGSFTGVRIGVIIAKTLAYTLNISIKTITSLEIFAVSNNSTKNKLVSISDLKGKYIGYFNKDNELINDYIYLKNSEYSEFIKDKEDYLIDNTKFDLNSIYNYLKTKDNINPHLVNPIYIKGIDALNG